MLLGVGIVLLVVGALVVRHLTGGRRVAERQTALERRVDAYMISIRREATHPALAAMSDVELRELLLSSARNLRVQAERRWYLLIGGSIVAFFSALMVATAEGVRGFGIALLIGALVVYGLNEFLGRRMREPLKEQGIDVERLRVE